MSARLSQDFLFGTATSSYQIEGDNFWSDWWQWETLGRIKNQDKSGKLCDFWNQPEKYLDLNKKLGANAFKISLEWARLNPKEDQWNEDAFKRYLKIIRAIKQQGMEPIVGLWHFSLPQWFSEKGGWLNKNALSYWEQYVLRVKNALAGEVSYWLTLNEPTIYVYKGYVEGTWPPGRHNPWQAWQVRQQLKRAHQLAYALLKQPQTKISASTHLAFIETQHPWFPLEKLVAQIYRQLTDWGFLQAEKQNLDFISLNYYFHDVINLNPLAPLFRKKTSQFSDLGWEIYPAGIYQVVKQAYQLAGKPIIVMESGLADKDDRLRQQFISDHLKWLFQAKQEGVPVKGYLHWSLVDNFEWQEGRTPRFGLVEMDYEKIEPKPRPSFWFYKKLIETYRKKLKND